MSQNLLFCRACIATNVKMFSLEDTRLNIIFESITGIPHTKLMKSVVCYECAAFLYKCLIFKEKVDKAEEIFEEFMNHDKLEDNISDLSIIEAKRCELKLVLKLCNDPLNLELTCDNVDSQYFDVVHSYSNRLQVNSSNSMLVDMSPWMEDEDVSFGGKENSSDDEDNIPLSKHKSESKENKVHRQKVKKKIRKRKKKVKSEDETSVHSFDGVIETITRDHSSVSNIATIITLSHSEQVEELHKRKLTTNYTNSPYKCDNCFKGFLEPSSYNNHMQKHNQSSGKYICAVCKIRCLSARVLRKHITSTHSRKYKCKRCGNISNTANQANRHEKWHTGFTYKCQHCDMSFKIMTTYLSHVRLRHPAESVCYICGDAFIGIRGLMLHMTKTHHKNLNEGQLNGEILEQDLSTYCSECCIQFTTLEAWKRHRVTSTKHSSNGCRVCGEIFDTEDELTSHIQQVHYKRNNQQRIYADDDKTNGNANNTSINKPTKCGDCGSVLSSIRTFHTHYKRIHLGIKYKPKKDIICETCGMKFVSTAMLGYHQRVHTGEKPYECDICHKRFSLRQRLQLHERVHTGERPHPCPLCPKAFRQKSALNRHSMVHSGIKPYACLYCDKTFSQSSAMKLHVDTVHLKIPHPYNNKERVRRPKKIVHNSIITD